MCVVTMQKMDWFEGAGLLFNISRIQNYNLFNFNGEKCVKLTINTEDVLSKVSTIILCKKSEAKMFTKAVF